MPTQAKRQENIDKHLTAAEIEARQRAEAGVIPDRKVIDLKPPKLMAKNTVARRYWKAILKRMDGLEILDDLDSEMLGVYCVQMAEYEALCAEGGGSKELRTLEKSLLTYAEKLGLTPSGRARLAAKRAAAETEADPDADLFGD